MTLARQREAREAALDFYRMTMLTIADIVIEVRNWKYANAELLALEAKYMVHSLRTDPGFVAARKLRVAIWRKRYRAHAARAWAKDALVASACQLHPGAV